MINRQDSKNGHGDFKSAALAGLVENTFLFPIDTSIRRIQYSTVKIDHLQSFFKTIFADAYNKNVFAKIRSLYQGFMRGAFFKLTNRPYKFGCQPVLRRFLEKKIGDDCKEKIGEKNAKTLIEGAAGGLIGLGEVLLFHPFNTLIIRRQNNIQTPWYQLIAKEKFNLYRGADAAILRNVPGSIALFGVSSSVLSFFGVQDPKKASVSQNLAAATLGASVSVGITNPQDLVKTRLQMQPPGSKMTFFPMFKTIAQKEGISTLLTKGLTLRLLNGVPKLMVPFVLTRIFGSLLDQSAPSPQIENKSLKK